MQGWHRSLSIFGVVKWARYAFLEPSREVPRNPSPALPLVYDPNLKKNDHNWNSTDASMLLYYTGQVLIKWGRAWIRLYDRRGLFCPAIHSWRKIIPQLFATRCEKLQVWQNVGFVSGTEVSRRHRQWYDPCHCRSPSIERGTVL